MMLVDKRNQDLRSICGIHPSGQPGRTPVVVLNCHQLSARRGLIVTGPSGTTKTTAITRLIVGHGDALRLRPPISGGGCR